MEGQAIHSALNLAIGGAVGTFCRFLVQAGVRGVWASVLAALISLLVVTVLAADAADFARGNYTKYLLTYAEVLAIAAGAFHGMAEAQKKLSGTGAGLFLVGALLLSSTACLGSTSTPQTAPQIPPVASFSDDVQQAKAEIYGILLASARLNDRAADTYLEAQKVALSLKAPIPADVDAAVRKAGIDAAEAIIAARHEVRNASASLEQLQPKLQAVVDKVNAMSNVATAVANRFSSGGWRGVVLGLVDVVSELGKVKTPQPLVALPPAWPVALELGGAR
jgi:hypothetical protein